MKKKALLLLTLAVISTSIFAQDKKLRLGLTLFPTLNVFKPDVEAIEKSANGFGFSYGLLGDYSFGENYAFSTGLLINSTSGTLRYADRAFPDTDRSNNFAAITEADYNLKYISIPLTLKLRTNEIGYITYYGQFGLGLDINIKATQDTETKYGNGQTLTDKEVDISDDIKLFRTALVIGAGIEYNISGNTAIQVGLTFNNGFSNILNGSVPELDTDGNVKVDDSTDEIESSSKQRSATNNYFALNLGIFF
ncbi:MAG: opacity protein-like surface antigen [Flavobacteriales bacterium]|jgi:opacity protein-like surface antigen